MHTRRLLLIASLMTLSTLPGCSSGGGGGDGGTGTLVVDATDAPFDHDSVRSARLCVTRILAHKSGSANSGFQVIYDGSEIEFDLIDLRNGITERLAAAEIPAGRYKQLRLLVSKAELVVKHVPTDKIYSTEEGAMYRLNPTSATSSGFKVKLDPPVEVVDGFSTTLVLDFLLTRTFHPIPANVADPADATSFNLQPTIRAFTSTGAEIRGTVTDVGGPVEGATVEVFPEDPDNAGIFLMDAFGETATDAAGEYSVPGLPAGNYQVVVNSGLPRDVTLAVGEIATEDFGI